MLCVGFSLPHYVRGPEASRGWNPLTFHTISYNFKLCQLINLDDFPSCPPFLISLRGYETHFPKRIGTLSRCMDDIMWHPWHPQQVGSWIFQVAPKWWWFIHWVFIGKSILTRKRQLFLVISNVDGHSLWLWLWLTWIIIWLVVWNLFYFPIYWE